MNRATWAIVRRREVTKVDWCCWKCLRDLRYVVSFDVIRGASGYLVLCRSCRVKHQAAAVQAKRAATLRARRAQLRLPHVRRSAA